MQLYHTLSVLHKGNDYYDVQTLLLIRFIKIDQTRAVKGREGGRERERKERGTERLSMQLCHTLSMLLKGNNYYDVQILLLIRFFKIDQRRALSREREIEQERERERKREREREREREIKHAVVSDLINVPYR